MINDFDRWLESVFSVCPKAGARPCILLKRIEYPVELSREQAIQMSNKLWNLAVEIKTLDEFLDRPTQTSQPRQEG